MIGPSPEYGHSVNRGAVEWIALQQHCGLQAAHIFLQESSAYGITGDRGQP